MSSGNPTFWGAKLLVRNLKPDQQQRIRRNDDARWLIASLSSSFLSEMGKWNWTQYKCNMHWILLVIGHGMLLLENQIPFFILHHLFELVETVNRWSKTCLEGFGSWILQKDLVLEQENPSFQKNSSLGSIYSILVYCRIWSWRKLATMRKRPQLNRHLGSRRWC